MGGVSTGIRHGRPARALGMRVMRPKDVRHWEHCGHNTHVPMYVQPLCAVHQVGPLHQIGGRPSGLQGVSGAAWTSSHVTCSCSSRPHAATTYS